MEGGGGGPFKPFSPSANSLRNVEQRKSDNHSSTEMLENCLAGKAEGAMVPLSSEEMVEIAATRDCPPKSSSVPDVSLQVSHGLECRPDASRSYGFLGTNGSPYWGEEMLRSPEPHSHPSNRNKISKASHHREGHLGNPDSNLSSEKQGSTNVPPLHSSWSELKTETLATNNVIGPAEPSHWSNGKSEAVVIKDRIPNGEDDDEDDDDDDDDNPALLAMFHAVANSHLAVRSQQKDEPDFTPAQKLAILQDLYYTKPLVFLERFRTALREEHLPCFRHLSGSYEADFYCAEVRRASLGKTRHTRVRNKRYAALQQLIQGGEYFSDEQMRCRDPLLYEQYIGQYLSDTELQELGSYKLEASCSLSGVLLDSYQEQVIQRRLQIQQEQEDACEEEEEEDDDDDNGEAKASDFDMEEWVPDQEEKAILREEFTSRMYQHFLDGKDGDFDYSEVDENPDFDNLDIVSRDEEERYFDGEDPENADAMDAE